MNNNWSRRDFLKTASAATLAALTASYPKAIFADEVTAEKLIPTADTVIVLWMAGGMAHTETFDPKRYTPFEVGLSPSKVLSTFPSIDTVVDNIKLSQGLENVAKVMDRGDADSLVSMRATSGSFCIRGISINGTPDTRRRRRWRARISAR